MRLGVMCHSSCGGSARVASWLSSEMSRRGHSVHLFTLTTPFFGATPADGVVLHRILDDGGHHLGAADLYPVWRARELKLFLARLLAVTVREELELLHFHYAVPFAFICQAVKYQLGRKAPALVGTLHGTDVSIHGRAPATKYRLADALRELDAITTVSVSHADLATALFGLTSHPTVIPNFINLSRFRSSPSVRRTTLAMNNRRPIDRLRPRIAHVSNFRPVKDPESVARIFLGIRERMDAELWLVGEGPELGRIRSLLRANGTVDVRSWGLQPDVAPILAQTDLLLMASLSESFCLAALEAMACGVPVLATRVGGLPEVVVHGKTGFLFSVGDHSSAVEFAVRILSDPVRHQAFSEAAAAHAGRFAHTMILPRYDQLYGRILEDRKQGGPPHLTSCGDG